MERGVVGVAEVGTELAEKTAPKRISSLG